jgi:REP element-mobilizing transposase RayT
MHTRHVLRSGHSALRKNRYSQPEQIYLVTATTKRRQPFFQDPAACFAVCPSFENRRLLGDNRMLCWVLMPDHVHWLVQLGYYDSLATLINRLKSFSSREANCALQRTGALWEAAFHDRAVRRDEDHAAAMRYIMENPLRARLAENIAEYAFWNSIWV